MGRVWDETYQHDPLFNCEREREPECMQGPDSFLKLA